MNFATIKYYDIANGPGVRTSVFVSGCRHHCPGCFNEVAWDFGYGKPFDKATRNEVFASCQPDYIAGISLLGGEPMEPENQRELLPLCPQLQGPLPQKDGLVLLRLHLGAADRGGPLPRPVRSHRRAAGPAGCAGGRPLCAGRARHLPPFPGQPEPAAAGCPQVPCRRRTCLVAGRAGLFHPYDVILSVNAPHCQLLLPLSLTRHLPPAGGSLSKGEPLASFKSTAKLQCKTAL